MLKQNTQYYERISKARKEKEEIKSKALPDYSLRYDERKRKYKMGMANSYCATDVE